MIRIVASYLRVLSSLFCSPKKVTGKNLLALSYSDEKTIAENKQEFDSRTNPVLYKQHVWL